MPESLPERYEAGTLSTPAIVALGSGLKYISNVGIDNIEERLYRLTYMLEERLSCLNGITIYKSGNGILSFNIGNLPSSYIAGELDKYGICTRGGIHCAPSVHRKLETLKQGAVRVSLSNLNKELEIDHFYKALKSIAF